MKKDESGTGDLAKLPDTASLPVIEGTQQATRPEHPMQYTEGGGTVLVSGASGLVGRALLERLAGRGQRTTRLVRSAASEGEALWDPLGGTIDESSR